MSSVIYEVWLDTSIDKRGDAIVVQLSRRLFLKQASAAGLALGQITAMGRAIAQDAPLDISSNPTRFGALVSDPRGYIDLPLGFHYRVISEPGQRMSDGLLTPGRPDGMAAFAGPWPGTCSIVRNHEQALAWHDEGAYEETDGIPEPLDRRFHYEIAEDGRPENGGTSTFIYDLNENRILASWLSLSGTILNCAGGATPWGSWLSCEEAETWPRHGLQRTHGWVFEVPAHHRGLVEPVPLRDMGRFTHEAAAVDPNTGIVYLTEDATDGLFYRFLPVEPGSLHRGGQLQALTIAADAPADTRNFSVENEGLGEETFPLQRELPVRWTDVTDPYANETSIREIDTERGAAFFCRGEGMSITLERGGLSVYFAATEGGAAQKGQIFRHRPNAQGGTLELVYESPGVSELDKVDNIDVTPWGELLLCEDGDQDNYLRIMSSSGEISDFARNAHPDLGEFAGATWSPDGSTLFVNIQDPGYTLAITGPWPSAYSR